MITPTFVREFILALPDVTEAPHFDRTAFKVRGKIFATMHEKSKTMNLRFTPANQDIFSLFDKNIIYPIPNKWGLKGWTTVELQTVLPDMFKEALKTAYCDVAPKELAEKIEFS
jgi:hypothetical protein